MDRTEYLKICQKVSLLKTGVAGIKENIPAELLIRYNQSAYYPVAYELSFVKGETRHIAILHSLYCNSVINCELSKVEKYISEVNYE